MYKVKNMRTGEVYGPYKTRKAAQNVADRKDTAYGAVCCVVVFI